MTVKQYPEGATKNKVGNGRGLKAVTKPLTKKRGVSKDRSKTIAENRLKYTDLSSVPAAELADHVDPNKPLTEKAKIFVKMWAQGETIANASARAGYGDGATYAYRVSKFPQALALYNEEKRLFEEASHMSRKKVLDGLIEGIEMAKMMAEPASVINGWKTIGQMCGYFEPVKHRIDVNVSGSVQIEKMNRLSDDDLIKYIEQGALETVERLDDQATSE